ncbi:MAG: Yip1 family protein, partial [Vitreimonas sp.]
MTIDPNLGAAAPGLVDRIRNILLSPQTEWDRISGEPADVSKLYMGYVLPLAALSALCGFIGISIFGIMGIRIGIVPGLVGAVVQVIMALVGVFLLAFVTNALAPTFNSQQNIGQAHKLAAYSSTAGFLAGVFTLIPALSILALVGLYSLVLLYIGLPRMMKTPEDKRIPYFITIIVVCIVVGVVLNVLMMSVRGMLPGSAPSYGFSQVATPGGTSAEVTLPGGGAVNLSELEKQAEALASGAPVPAVDPARLQERLPESLPGGFTRTSLSSGSAMGTAQAEARYENGEARIDLTVMHMGPMGAMATVASAANVQENRQDADGYSRTQTVDGRVYNEEVSNRGASASYGVIG